jgi:hypothetical protein
MALKNKKRKPRTVPLVKTIYKVWQVGTVGIYFFTVAKSEEEAIQLVVKSNKLDGSKKYQAEISGELAFV